MPHLEAVRTDWAIYWTLGKFLKPLAIINLPKSPTFIGNFVNVFKSIIFLVKSFLGNFYRHFVIFFWSHFWKTGHTAYDNRRPRFKSTHRQVLLAKQLVAL